MRNTLKFGDVAGAARCAGWLGVQFMNLGEAAQAGGWFARGQRLVEELTEPNVVEGFLLVPAALGKLYGGDPAGALQLFSQAADAGRRFQDRDLSALGPPWHRPGHPDAGPRGRGDQLVR